MTPEQFLLVADLFPDPALLLSGGAVLAASPAAVNQFGYAADEVRGRRLAEFVATPSDALAEYLRACSRSGQKVPGTLTVRAKDGRLVVCRADGKVVRPRTETAEALVLLRLVPKDDAVSRFVLLNQRIGDLSREVARRQKAEQDLRSQREWLHVTLSSIGDAVIATDAEGRVTFLNPAAEEMTGWPQHEAAGRLLEDVFDIVNEHTRERVENPVAKVLRDGQVVGLANHTVLRARGGGERPIDDCGAPIRNGGGRVIGAVLVFHDVSERREMERELRARAENLAEAARRKDEWIAMLAHELRGPLNPITYGVQILQMKGLPDPDLERAGEVIARQVRHLARLIEDLLDVNRINQGQMRLQVERLDLARLVRTATEDFRPALHEAGLTLTAGVPDTPVWVEGDRSRLTQVLHNLLDNARKFTDHGGEVDVRLEADPAGRRAEIRVRDSGAGIGPELVGRLFEPFNQADRSLHRTKGGLGLGLALVKGLTELHGGNVAVSSGGPGRGAEFAVRLPLQEELAALSESRPPAKTAARGLRVLVIEDNPDSAESLRMLLRLVGHEVRVAYTGPDGVRAAAEWRPRVVLSDIGLPGLDGFGVARELRGNEQTAGALLVAVTGYSGDDDRRRARESGFDHVLGKPADPVALFQILEAVPTSLG